LFICELTKHIHRGTGYDVLIQPDAVLKLSPQAPVNIRSNLSSYC